jgi:hypothetical protein
MAFYDEKTHILIIKWNVEDVLNVRPDLNEEEAKEVLCALANDFDANIGVNWAVIEIMAEEEFPEAQQLFPGDG